MRVERIKAQDKNVPAAFESMTGYIVIDLINLFLGAMIGIVLVGIDLWIRDHVLKNARLFSAPTARTDTSSYGVTTPVAP